MNPTNGIPGTATPKAKAIYTGMTTLDRTHKRLRNAGKPFEVVAKVIVAREHMRAEYLHEIGESEWPR